MFIAQYWETRPLTPKKTFVFHQRKNLKSYLAFLLPWSHISRCCQSHVSGTCPNKALVDVPKPISVFIVTFKLEGKKFKYSNEEHTDLVLVTGPQLIHVYPMMENLQIEWNCKAIFWLLQASNIKFSSRYKLNNSYMNHALQLVHYYLSSGRWERYCSNIYYPNEKWKEKWLKNVEVE